MPFTIVREDITKMNVDAIVNAANTSLQMGSGICGAIFRAAGARELQAACDRISPIRTGDAVITPGFALPARYVIHAAGPVYDRWHKKRCREQLRSAYLESLKLASDHGCTSIAFPLISSGIYGYPKNEALEVARTAIGDFLRDHDIDIYLAVLDRSSFHISRTLLGDVEKYIEKHYVDDRRTDKQQSLRMEDAAANMPLGRRPALPLAAASTGSMKCSLPTTSRLWARDLSLPRRPGRLLFML